MTLECLRLQSRSVLGHLLQDRASSCLLVSLQALATSDRHRDGNG